MSGYSAYDMILDKMGRMASPMVDKKHRKGERFLKFFLKMQADALPAWVTTMEFSVVLDELCVNECGNTMVFMENEDLVRMLWDARMDIDLEDIDLSVLPHGFTVAWPDMEVDGVKLSGCSVWVGTIAERDKCIARHTKKYLGREIPVKYDDERIPEELGMSVCYCNGDNANPLYYRCSVPQRKMREVVGSEEGMKNLGFYDTFGSLKLTDKEVHEQYVMVRLILRMMAYVTARPDFMVGGFPDGAKSKVFSTRSLGRRSGMRVSYPSHAGHGSPKAHWRSCHIRSYPKRKDGSKRKGVVFIAGTMVNVDVDPVTVKEVER